jgi:hypothetical protein
MIEGGMANCGGDGGLDSGEFGHMRVMIVDRAGPIQQDIRICQTGGVGRKCKKGWWWIGINDCIRMTYRPP